MGDQNSAELVRRCLNGDETAFREMVGRYATAVYRRVIRMVRNPDDAEDLAQEAFAAAFENLEQLREPAGFSAWLFRIADTRALMHLRRRPKQLSLVDALTSATREPSDASQSHRAADQRRAMVRQALRRLTAEHREVIAYHYYKGYSYAETADLLSLTTDRVRSRLQKARARLGKELAKMGNTASTPQSVELMREDVEALDRAMGMASTDEKRPVLRALYIDIGGKIVSTDGHRLMIWPSKRLAAIPVPILFGPVDGARIGPCAAATMEIDAREVRFLRDEGPPVTFAIVERPYVKYEEVIPKAHQFRITAELAALQEMVDRLAPCLGPMHPADAPWTYVPQVELRVSPQAGIMTLGTASDMGFGWLDADGKRRTARGLDGTGPDHGPAASRTDWSFTATTKVQVEGSPEGGVFRAGVNHSYLKDALQALGVSPGAKVGIAFGGPLKAIVLRLSGVEGRLALVMPLRLAASS